ncbi:hypothetical protein ANANG_G00044470 [Anguilla anguilla]|uniref:Integrase core domain-containing protein n=1 Tax=Anguilla anguilla TaxID=7936 RepID=A0A9D3MWG5_ANGAN|nr:hypothetical protein ANANG_G00044470 [Anguilla anguilla]
MHAFLTISFSLFYLSSRTEHLWRDMWMAVSNVFYDVLHSLEEEDSFDPANSLHLFCAHCVFLPCLQAALDAFTDGWNNHPMRTEQNLSPNQMWEMGCIQYPVPAPDNKAVDDIATIPEDLSAGVVPLPPMECPLTQQGMARLRAAIDPSSPSQDHGQDIYITIVNYVLLHNIWNTQEDTLQW